jgi:hypothetical protein
VNNDEVAVFFDEYVGCLRNALEFKSKHSKDPIATCFVDVFELQPW